MLLRLQTAAQPAQFTAVNAALFPHSVDTGWIGINLASKMQTTLSCPNT